MRVIFFDLDGTLIDSTAAFPKVFAQVVSGHGLRIGAPDVSQSLDSAWSWYETNLALYHRAGARDFWLGFNHQVCLGLGATEGEALAMAEEITDTFRRLNLRKLFPDSIDCLNALTGDGYRLGVITARPDARDVTDPLGISHYFSYIIDACAANSAKSDAKIYRYALSRAKLRGSEAIHVGDEIKRDILPAQAAGMLPVLIDRNDKHPHTDHLRIAELDSLPKLVRDLSPGPV